MRARQVPGFILNPRDSSLGPRPKRVGQLCRMGRSSAGLWAAAVALSATCAIFSAKNFGKVCVCAYIARWMRDDPVL